DDTDFATRRRYVLELFRNAAHVLAPDVVEIRLARSLRYVSRSIGLATRLLSPMREATRTIVLIAWLCSTTSTSSPKTNRALMSPTCTAQPANASTRCFCTVESSPSPPSSTPIELGMASNTCAARVRRSNCSRVISLVLPRYLPFDERRISPQSTAD